MKTISHICVGLLALLFLATCSDHRLVNTTQRLRVKTVDTRASRIAVIYSFDYDDTGKLASFTTRTHPDPATPSQITVLQYDMQGRLIQSKAQPTPRASGTRTAYKYNASGNLVSVTTLVDDDRSGNYILRDEVTLAYEGASKDPIRISKNDQVIALTYQDGNVVEAVTTSLGSVPTAPYIASYTYDNHPNPLYNLSAALINTFLGGLDLLSKNNANKADIISTYNANGLLIKRSNAGLTLFSETTYEYEAY